MQPTKTQTDKLLDMDTFNGFMKLVFIINGILTLLFGMTYLASTFDVGHEIASKIIAGASVVVFFDFAAFAWYKASMGDNLTSKQRSIAKKLSQQSILGSIVVSVVQIGTTTTLVDLSSISGEISIFGLVLCSLAAWKHFKGVFDFRANSADELTQDAKAEQDAILLQWRIDQRRATMERVMNLAREQASKEEPKLAQMESEAIIRDYLASYKNSAPVDNTSTPVDNTPEIARQAINGNGHSVNFT